MPLPERHIQATRTRLAHLGGLSAKSDAADKAILHAAEQRLAVVDSDLAKLSPRAIADAAAGDAYQRLTLERGQLVTVIARAQAAP
jgi:2-phospho-L-lactate guanylyltransferase (CobY/MobA/RfbA family)